MTFSEMLCSVRNIQIEVGDLKGICCVCGKYTQQGHRKKFGVNFTAGNYLKEGDWKKWLI